LAWLASLAQQRRRARQSLSEGLSQQTDSAYQARHAGQGRVCQSGGPKHGELCERIFCETGSWDVKIRRAKASDAARCAKISLVRTAEELKKLLKQDDAEWLVLEDDSGVVVGLGIIHFWAWNKMAWIWDLTVDEAEREKGYGTALLKGMLKAAKRGGARVMMEIGTPNPRAWPLTELLINNGFRICGTNDRWFADHKNPTAVFYGYDL